MPKMHQRMENHFCFFSTTAGSTITCWAVVGGMITCGTIIGSTIVVGTINGNAILGCAIIDSTIVRGTGHHHCQGQHHRQWRLWGCNHGLGRGNGKRVKGSSQGLSDGKIWGWGCVGCSHSDLWPLNHTLIVMVSHCLKNVSDDLALQAWWIILVTDWHIHLI